MKTLFDGCENWEENPPELWEKEWQGMPEFIQSDLTSFKSIIIHFATINDMRDFARLIDQTITIKTQSIWYPKAKIDRYIDKVYTDES